MRVSGRLPVLSDRLTIAVIVSKIEERHFFNRAVRNGSKSHDALLRPFIIDSVSYSVYVSRTLRLLR